MKFWLSYQLRLFFLVEILKEVRDTDVENFGHRLEA